MKTMRKTKLLHLLAVLLFLLSLSPAALAAQTGSLKVSEIDDTVGLYWVGTADGKLTSAFAGASVDALTDPEQVAANARVLWEYARRENLEGQRLTPGAEESVLFENLEQGIYLVVSLRRGDAEFDPFLVSIPTTINGQPNYNVEAFPKQEKPDKPPRPTRPTPTEPEEPEPEIPQTGISVIPKYLLLGVGSAVTLAGLYQLIRGKEEAHE